MISQSCLDIWKVAFSICLINQEVQGSNLMKRLCKRKNVNSQSIMTLNLVPKGPAHCIYAFLLRLYFPIAINRFLHCKTLRWVHSSRLNSLQLIVRKCPCIFLVHFKQVKVGLCKTNKKKRRILFYGARKSIENK